MNLLAPSFLWLLGLLPVIVVLYLLKLRRRELRISSTLLWNRLVHDLRATTPLQKLHRNILLLLQLLTVLSLAIALARPFVRVHAVSGRNICLIIDASASMKATDVHPSRFAAARDAALRMVDQLGPGDVAMVIAASSQTQVASALTRDKRQLRRALEALTPRDTGCDLREALVLGQSMVRTGAQGVVIVFSDGAMPPLDDVGVDASGLRFVRIGRRAENVGITALSARRGFSKAAGQELFVSLRNFGTTARHVPLEIIQDDRLLAAREVNIPAGSARSEIFDDLPLGAGVVAARADVTDDLPVDNVAYLRIARRKTRNVLLVTPGNLFLETALNLDASVRLMKVSPTDYRRSDKADVVVFDGDAPAGLPPGGYLLIGGTCPDAPAAADAEIEHPEVLDWDRVHPVMRYVSFAGVQLARALKLIPHDWAQPLVETATAPLIVVGEHDRRRLVQLGFNLRDSDFALRVGFPIFITNALRWLAGDGGEGTASVVRAGTPVRVNVPENARQVVIVRPDGSRHTVEVSAPELTLTDTDQVGVYRVEAGGKQTGYAVSLLDRDESNIRPRDALHLGSVHVAATAGAAETNRELWPWLVLLALGVISVEWFLYHRGGV